MSLVLACPLLDGDDRGAILQGTKEASRKEVPISCSYIDKYKFIKLVFALI